MGGGRAVPEDCSASGADLAPALHGDLPGTESGPGLGAKCGEGGWLGLRPAAAWPEFAAPSTPLHPPRGQSCRGVALAPAGSWAAGEGLCLCQGRAGPGRGLSHLRPGSVCSEGSPLGQLEAEGGPSPFSARGRAANQVPACPAYGFPGEGWRHYSGMTGRHTDMHSG